MVAFLILLSILIELVLLWIVYGKTPHAPEHFLASYLPILSAIFNSLSAITLIAARNYAKKKQIKKHLRFILLALFFSALFLLSYLTYHWMVGRVSFALEGGHKFFILTLLLLHVFASIINLPMIFITLYYGLTFKLERHKRLAPKTFYLWQFVSWSGVVIILYPILFN